MNFNASQNYNIILSLPENYSYTYGNMLANGNYKIVTNRVNPLVVFSDTVIWEYTEPMKTHS
ncbi:MAG: hypothetical protein HC906_01795 [Bacteroidales bacterium]|nr:hypothetical protein [Bacteroidales bacterium]